MKLIIDNNILFSLMNPSSTNSFLFANLDAVFFAPFFIIKEFDKYEKDCLKKSKLSKQEFKQRKEIVFSKINFVEFDYFKNLIQTAESFCPDVDDVFYFALALKLNIPLWSNDKKLKEQREVIVLDTRDVIEFF